MDEPNRPGGLADRLDAWSPAATVLVLLAGGLALASVDHAFPKVGMGPAYLPLIALAGWRLGLRASCCVAVIAGLMNVLLAHHNEVGLTPDVAIARGMVRLSAYAFTVVLVHALRGAYDRERFRATRDGLTGALNRAAFDRDMNALLDPRDAGGFAAALVLIDVDDFKRINDTHGHGAGDHVLRTLTAAAMNALGKRSCLFRIGGDEFAVLMPLASLAAGPAAVEKLHADISAVLDRSLYATTVSMGAVVFQPAPSLDRAALMLAADRHMYEGKAMGKGRVRVTTLRLSAAPAPELMPTSTWPVPAA